jgi:uncharacterized protein YhaN
MPKGFHVGIRCPDEREGEIKMRINELKLLNFGKFSDKSIKFDRGLNVIFGNNEAGKSTIHKFIEGMLYGFVEDIDKYRPWKQAAYRGEMTCEVDGKNIRIVRDFNENTTKVFELNNHKDITEEFSFNKKLNLLEPGKTVFGVNRKVFRNTFSIGQLGSQTEEELLIEIKTKIDNISKTKDETIRLKDTFQYLKDCMINIGNPDNLSDDYGFVMHKINSIQDEIKKREDLDLKLKRKLMLIDSYMKELNSIGQSITRFAPLLGTIALDQMIENYQQAVKLSEEINQLSLEIGCSENDLEVNIEDYEKLIRINSKLEQLQQIEEELLLKKIALTDEIESIKNNYLINENADDYAKIDANYDLYLSNHKIIERLEKKIRDINQEIKLFEDNQHQKIFQMYEQFNVNQREIQYLKDALNSDVIPMLKSKVKKEISTRTINIVFSLLLSGLVIAGSYVAVKYYNNPLMYMGLGLLLIPLFSLTDIGRSNKLVRIINKEIESINQENLKHKSRLTLLNEENNTILIETESESMNDLKEKYGVALQEISNIEEKKKSKETIEEEYYYIKKKTEMIETELMNKLSAFGFTVIEEDAICAVKKRVDEANKKFDQLENLQLSLQACEIKIEEVAREKKENLISVDNLLDRNQVTTVSELKKHIKEQKNFQDKLLSRKTKVEALTELLGDKSLEELADQIQGHEELIHSSEYKSRDEVQAAYQELVDKSQDLSEKIDRLKQNLHVEQNGVRILSELEEELDYYQIRKKEFEKEKNRVQDTLQLIHQLAEKNQESFTPRLARKAGAYLHMITGGKYSEISIDKQMNIEIVDKSNQSTVGIHSLSAGTMDQVYFCIRFALVDILSKDKEAPVILDDCFTQYDKKRLRNAMDILSEISAHRQVILFTCHLREKEMLNHMNTKYQDIELS